MATLCFTIYRGVSFYAILFALFLFDAKIYTTFEFTQ